MFTIPSHSATLGRVDRGSTMTDYLECEQDHGITVNSASVQCQYKGYTLNIIDTPGHIDFNVEVSYSPVDVLWLSLVEINDW